jgi:DNA repair protein RecN (Recombination protein N)
VSRSVSRRLEGSSGKGEDSLLLELRVRDFGIIEDIRWSLGRGLNVITGETGAGKSLVIDAVEALLTGKIDEEDIRYGAGEACIEGVFVLSEEVSSPQLGAVLADNGLDAGEDTLVISCELRRGGRSVVRVNGHAVSRGLLYQLGCLLIDIHGQSDHLSLFNTEYHLDFLDAYAHTLELRRLFSTRAAELYQAEQEIESLTKAEKETAQREELLRFQVDEIRQASLREGEETEMEQERDVIAASEKLKAAGYEVYHALYGEDATLTSASAIEKLEAAVQAMRRLVELDPSLRQKLALLEGLVPELEEVARDIHAYADRMEYDPERLEEIESRLELIRNLKRKYGRSITQVLDYREKAERDLEGLSLSSERRAELEGLCRRLKEEMGKMAFELSQARSQAAGKLVSEVISELRDLKMPRVQFEVSLKQQPAEEGIPFPDGTTYAFNKLGVDSVEFMASTNLGEPVKPLVKIASTGEISRFMLALKGALSRADNIPVLVFDEIDIGVGGRCGEIIGRKLWALTQNRQVICVTHLPQIAAFADAHYNIQKTVAGERTLSNISFLEDESRTRELAAMLAGLQYTEASVRSARELVQKAESWKEGYRKQP